MSAENKKKEIAVRVREVTRCARKGVLSTVDPEGHPYASLHAFAVAQNGCPLLLFSDLSQHTRNARAEPRASFLVERAAAKSNPQEIERASLAGRLVEEHTPEERERYLRYNPEAAMYISFGDFHLFRLEVVKARYVGGFAMAASVGESVRIDPALANELAEAEQAIITHMNKDHADACQALAMMVGGEGHEGGEEAGWQMCGIDAEGCDLIVPGRPGDIRRVRFPRMLKGVNDSRTVLVELTRQARA